jgi:hypothetical protein
MNYFLTDDELYSDDDAFTIFDALVSVTGYDSFALATHGLDVYYGEDYEHPITRDILEQASTISNFKWWYVRDVLLDRLCDYKL